MSLHFLDPDPDVPYIGEAVKKYQHAFRTGQLYRKGMRPGIVVVDVQKGFTSPDCPLGTQNATPAVRELAERGVQSLRRLIEVGRELGVPIIYTGTRYRVDGSDCGIRREKMPTLMEYFRDGLPWADIDERIAPLPSEPVVWKKVASPFFGTNLAMLLMDRRVDTVVLGGTSTSGCVRAAALDAISWNFRTVVAEECCFDRSLPVHKANLFDIYGKIADVAPLAEVTDWLRATVRGGVTAG
ncbi:MAG: isochorismatase family protein [SAR202 cluster bacterium]|nr:isochorismatase family protein [SAR202 cluster bacterium]